MPNFEFDIWVSTHAYEKERPVVIEKRIPGNKNSMVWNMSHLEALSLFHSLGNFLVSHPSPVEPVKHVCSLPLPHIDSRVWCKDCNAMFESAEDGWGGVTWVLRHANG